MGAKSRGPRLATAGSATGAASLTALGRPAARLDTGIRCFAWVTATNGTAAEIEAQRPLAQHPCCCATMGADVQQVDNVSTASANTAPIEVSRTHVRLFTRTT